MVATAPDLRVIYALGPWPRDIYTRPSIFLMGPTPRYSADPQTALSTPRVSWRQSATTFLRRRGFTGYIIVPEPRPDPDGAIRFKGDYLDQVEWEEIGLSIASVILAYVPRSMPDLPGLTTNAEWGEWKNSGKIVLGAPTEAQSLRYLQHQAINLGVPVTAGLEYTVISAINLLERLHEPSCPFCQIATTDNHNQVIWRGRDSVAFEPFHPVVPGHILVIPRLHAHGALSHPHISARVMSDAMTYVRAHGPQSLNIITSVGAEATQTMYHLHLHIVPRQRDDALSLPWTGQASPKQPR